MVNISTSILIIALCLISANCQLKPVVTVRTFMDISIGGVPAGRIVFGLYGNILPITVENFRALCTGEKGAPYHYKNTPIHRVIPKFVVQGGDIINGRGANSKSIYGGFFKDENFQIKHSKYCVAMANYGPNTNGSQFYITTEETGWLDYRNVVFGIVESGRDVVDKISLVGSASGTTSKKVLVTNSGVL